MAQKTVLLIDDEQGFLEALADALTYEGYRVLTASTGEEGLRIAAAERIDLATVDVMMPPGPSLENQLSPLQTGVYVVQELRKRNPKLPIFCLSVITDEQTIRAIQQNRARFFRKGETSLKHILDSIHSALTGIVRSDYTPRRWPT
jgi:DNA-binding response OmpR family regulator